MLPQKIFKIKGLRLAKNAFPFLNVFATCFSSSRVKSFSSFFTFDSL